MTTRGRAGRDDDGVRVVRGSGGGRMWWLIAAAVALPVVVTVVAVAVIRGTPRATPQAATAPLVVAAGDPPPAEPAPRATPLPKASPGRVVPRRVVAAPVAEPTGFGASPVPEPQKPRREIDAADAIAALREEGVHDGIAAFGIPGSHPPKSGILVPEDFPLPEGYVRHYQSTDDGEQLRAILMFHPDYEFLDERGAVVKLPEDLVVPPRMAPPGLDVDRVLEVPERPRGEPLR